MNIAILGYGAEGKSARRFLKKKYPRARIEIRDKKFGADYLDGLERFDMIVRSPGIPYLTPEIQRAKKAGVEITSATKLFFSALDDAKKQWRTFASSRKKKNQREGIKKSDRGLKINFPPLLAKESGLGGEVTVVGITGTKGKGTVATMLYQILKHAGKKALLVGNIGKPALDVLPKLTKNSIVIFELSSFQLQDLDCSPHIAVVLEIAPDHLDHHRSMNEYVDAKTSITRHQTRRDTAVYIAQNRFSKLIAQKGRGKKLAIGFSKNLRWASDVRLQVPGAYNIKNAIVAATIARYLGISAAVMRRAIENFRGLPYHMELTGEIRGVKFYNDSASTNPVATKAALEAISSPKVLIMGGVDKGFHYSMLKRPIARNHVRAVVLFGANKDKIQHSLRGAKVPIVTAKHLPHVLTLAQKRAHAGDAIIFSPASASFDMFQNSKERGKTFTRLVQQLACL